MLFMNLIITGNPGVGKHTVAAQIMKNEDYDMIDINKIAIDKTHVSATPDRQSTGVSSGAI